MRVLGTKRVTDIMLLAAIGTATGVKLPCYAWPSGSNLNMGRDLSNGIRETYIRGNCISLGDVSFPDTDGRTKSINSGKATYSWMQ